MISDCYNELMADASLLQSFSEDEWMSIHRLPYLHVLCFHNVSERLYTWLTSPVLWGKARTDFITEAGRRAMSAENAPLVILVMDDAGKGRLGMITIFCRSDQAKVEPLDTISTLVQWDSPMSGVVVVKVYTNSPYLPCGSFNPPYLDVTTLSVSTLTTNFPLSLLCLHRLLSLRSSFCKRKREMT